MRIVWDYFGHMRPWSAMRRYVRLDLGRTEERAEPRVATTSLSSRRGFSLPARRVSRAGRRCSVVTAALPARQGRPRRETPDRVCGRRCGSEAGDVAVAGLGAGRCGDAGTAAGRPERRRPDDRRTARAGLSRSITRPGSICNGSKRLTDDGLRYLARLPRLRHLELEWDAESPIAGWRCCDVCRSSSRSCWPGRASPMRASANLAGCDKLRAVDLSGTASRGRCHSRARRQEPAGGIPIRAMR